MAHTYTIDSVLVTPATDTVILTGSVDSIPVQINFWFSAVQGLTPAQKRQFVAPLMLAAAIGLAQVDGGAGVAGTFIQ